MQLRQENTKIHRTMDARNIRPISGFDPAMYTGLAKNLGITMDERTVRMMMAAANDYNQTYGMDALQPTVTTGSIVTPIQFLQEWLTGFVEVITAARKIDELIGMVVVGDWEMEQVVQGIRELTGLAIPYSDYGNMNRASWNTNFVYRTIVRGEQGMQVGALSEAISARINVNDGSSKRESCALALEIFRNLIGFFGYNNGTNLTYGFLNDPNLPNYVTFAVGASTSTLWSTKTFLEITADIRTMFATLRTQSLDNINPREIETTLALATDVVDYMTVTGDLDGYSVEKWLKDNYSKCRVVSAPELDLVNGGLNVAYLYADKIKDSSTDGGQVMIQMVPTKFKVTGVAKQVKGYEEDYTNATAGVMVKRPWGIVRFTGN